MFRLSSGRECLRQCPHRAVACATALLRRADWSASNPARVGGRNRGPARRFRVGSEPVVLLCRHIASSEAPARAHVRKTYTQNGPSLCVSTNLDLIFSLVSLLEKRTHRASVGSLPPNRSRPLEVSGDTGTDVSHAPFPRPADCLSRRSPDPCNVQIGRSDFEKLAATAPLHIIEAPPVVLIKVLACPQPGTLDAADENRITLFAVPGVPGLVEEPGIGRGDQEVEVRRPGLGGKRDGRIRHPVRVPERLVCRDPGIGP